jgi:hypothetical protein
VDFNEAKGDFFVTMVQIFMYFHFLCPMFGRHGGASIARWLYPVENVSSILFVKLSGVE